MGSNQPTQPKMDFDLVSEYKQLKQTTMGTILTHNQSQLTFLLKEFTYGSDMQFDHDRQRFERQLQNGVCDHVLSVIKIKTHTIHGLCSTTHKIYAIYQYPQVSLHDEILARQKQQKRFDEHQLWSVLQSCNSALSMLRPSISLNAHQVFITTDGQLKVVHNDMIDENYRFTINNNFYYAPQKIRNFNKMDSESGLIKQAVFSMGMTLLQAAALDQVIECYDYGQQLFLQTNLQSTIEGLQEYYSQDFVDILRHMLDANPARRCSFIEIQKLLDNYWNNCSEQSVIDENGESLKIQCGDDKKTFNTQDVKSGIFKNLATVNSNQKDSLRMDCNTSIKPVPIDKIKDQQSVNSKNQKIMQSKQEKNFTKQKIEPTQQMQRQEKQFLYTDPKLLEMIRKDLQDIHKLKQSTLKQTIKYSFLYPEGDSIFQSVKDIRQSIQNQQTSIQRSNGHVLTDKNTNTVGTSNKSKNQTNSVMRQSSGTDSDLHCKFQNLKINKEGFSEKQKEMQNRKNAKTTAPITPTYSKFVDQEGRQYQGYTLNGKKQGYGKLQFGDGAYYEGQFKQNRMEGNGTLYYSIGKPAYAGMWTNDLFHGHGILYNQNPLMFESSFDFTNFDDVQDYWIKYEGQFCQDCKCGFGRLQLTNGEVIEGMFDQDCMNGEGCFIAKNGKRIEGVWQMNQLVEVQRQ